MKNTLLRFPAPSLRTGGSAAHPAALALFAAGFFLLLSALVLSCASGAAPEEKPLWASQDTLDQAYPPAAYIARLGLAHSPEAAAALAESELASYFTHSVTLGTTASQQLTSDGRSSGNLTREVHIRAAMELFAVHKTEPWYDRARRRYAVAAYIDRAEAWGLYRPSLLSRREAFMAHYDQAAAESDPFKKIRLLHACQESGAAFQSDLDFLRLLAPAAEPDFAADRRRLAGLSQEMTAARLAARLCVRVQNDEEGRIERLLSAQLSGGGYYLSDSGYAYQVLAVIQPNLARHSLDGDTVFTAQPGISIAVTNGREELFSYSKSLERISGFSQAFVNKKLYAALEEEVQKSFLKEFKAALE